MNFPVTTIGSRSISHSAVQTRTHSLVYELADSKVKTTSSSLEADLLAQQLQSSNRTYLRLRELLLNRTDNAELLGYPVVDLSTFKKAKAVFDYMGTASESIRVGLSDLGGLELIRPGSESWRIVLLEGGSAKFEEHSGQTHIEHGWLKFDHRAIAEYLKGN